jgi:hypothetical protein
MIDLSMNQQTLPLLPEPVLEIVQVPLFSREWAMPNGNTFDVKPIGDFVNRYLSHSRVSVDPFARNKRWATYTNDLNPKTTAEYHLHAVDFLKLLHARDILCDLAILDAPYSPRQISECYKEAGIPCGMVETQNAKLYSEVKSALVPILAPNAIVLSFGWNTAGMGKKHGFYAIEIMICDHGGAHNATLCMAERRK